MTSAPPPPNPYQTVQPMSASDEKLWATLVHVGGIFFGFIPALVGYLVCKDRGPFVRHHTATALNFQLTLLIASFVGGILAVVMFVTVLLAPLGILIVLGLSVVVIVFSIIAAIRANNGQFYTYPVAIPFVS